MAQFDIYVDTYSGDTVKGPSDAGSAQLPQFIQGDTISLRIYLLARTPTWPISSPYTVINISALSLKVGIGPKDGNAGSTLLTQQFTWSKDPTNSYFFADLPLNTANIASAIGSGSSALTWFEIEYTQNGFPTTVLQRQISLQAEVIETGVVTVPPGATAITAEDVSATYLKKDNTGFTLTSPDGSKKAFVWLGNDGAFHCDPLT